MARKERLLRGLPVDEVITIQMRSVDKKGDKSAWSPQFQFRTTADTVAPSPPSNLQFADFGTSFAAVWDKPTTNEDGTNLADLGGYQVTVYHGTENVTYIVPSERFDFTHEMNIAAFGYPAPYIRIVVRAMDVNGNISQPLEMEADNQPPDNPKNVVLETGLESIFVSWTPNIEQDLEGYRVYVGNTENFPLDHTTQVYDGRGTAVAFASRHELDYYVRVTAYDRFGNESGPSDVQTVLGRGIDTEPPAVPTGLSLAVNSYVSGQVLLGRIVATWAGNTEADLTGYYIRIRKANSADYSTYFQDKLLSLYEFTGLLPSTAYRVSIAAVDKSNNVSDYSAEVQATTLGDTSAPVVPIMYDPRVDAGVVEFDWSDNTAPDFKDYVIQIAENAGFTVNLQQFYVNASRYSFVANPEKTYWARVAARDQHGNVSGWGVHGITGEYVSTKPSQIPSTYIQNLLVDKLVSGQIKTAQIELVQGAKIFSTGAWSLDVNEFFMQKGNIKLGTTGFQALNNGTFYSGGTTFDNATWRTSATGHMRVGGSGKFHVDESGAIWSGSEDKTAAPWRIDGDGYGFFDSIRLTGTRIAVGQDLVNAGDKFVLRKTSSGYDVKLAGNMDIESAGNLRLAGGSITILSGGNFTMNGGTMRMNAPGSVFFSGAPVTIDGSTLTLTGTGQLRAGNPGPNSNGVSFDQFGIRIWKTGSNTPTAEFLSSGDATFRGVVDGAIIKGGSVQGSTFTTAAPESVTPLSPTGTGSRVVIQNGADGITFWHRDSITGQETASIIRAGMNDGIEINGSLRVGTVGNLRTVYAASVQANQVQAQDSSGVMRNVALSNHGHDGYATSGHTHGFHGDHLQLGSGYQFRLYKSSGGAGGGEIKVAWEAWYAGTGIPNSDPSFADNAADSGREEIRAVGWGSEGRGVSGTYFRTASTEAIKANIVEAPSLLERFKKVQVKQYNFAEDVTKVKNMKLTAKKKQEVIANLPVQTGFIVEQLRDVMPELTLGDGVLLNDTVAALWKISQEQQAIIEDLQQQIEELKNAK